MTPPRFRRPRDRDARAPVFSDDRDITEVLGPPADWDGTTYQWGGASNVGLPDDGVQAVEQAETGTLYMNPDATRPRPLAAIRAGHSPRYPGPDMFPALQEPPPPSFTPAAPVGYEVTGRETGRGWPHLFEVRCAYPAALAATPIPCDSVHRDAAATSFRALRRSAQAARWHMDRLEQWACPRCCQVNPEYRTLYPVTVYDALAAEAHVARDQRGVIAAWMEADGPVRDPGHARYAEWVAAAGVEVAARAAAELGLLDRTLLHHASSHKRGRHADEPGVTR